MMENDSNAEDVDDVLETAEDQKEDDLPKKEQEEEVAVVSAAEDDVVEEIASPTTTPEIDTAAAAGAAAEADNNNNNNTPTAATAAPVTTTPSPNNNSSSSIREPTNNSNTQLELKEFEARRRSLYTSKYESSSLYWRSFRDLLHGSVHETGRAHRLIAGMSKAHQAYSDAMQAVYQDSYVDDKGQLLSSNRAARLGQFGKKKDGGEPSTPTNNNNNSGDAANDPTVESHSILTSFLEAQAVMAEKFGETEDDTQIALEIKNLQNDMQQRTQTMESIGNAILVELEQVEQQVQQAWQSYHGKTEQVAAANASSTSMSTPEVNTQSSMQDVWLVEMQYRVIVRYQKQVWDSGTAELSKLFSSMKDAECDRRIQLREFLIAFCQRQQRLFLSVPNVQKPVLQDLVQRRMDREAVEQEVQASIRQRALATIQQEQALPTPNTTTVEAQQQQTQGVVSMMESLGSPMSSAFLLRAKVLERKTFKGFKASLAVVTADGYLHLFDLPKTTASAPDNNNASSNNNPIDLIASKATPEVAFDTLLPKRGVKNWTDLLCPAETMMLAKCTLAMGKDVLLEVSEQRASKVFGKTKKVILRATTTDDRDQWMQVLKLAQAPCDAE